MPLIKEQENLDQPINLRKIYEEITKNSESESKAKRKNIYFNNLLHKKMIFHKNNILHQTIQINVH